MLVVRARAAVLACLVGWWNPVAASNIGVSPVLLDLLADEVASGVRVRNGDAAAVQVQARVFRWQQDDTGEVYTPATGLVVSPPVARIQPGGEQLIRVVRVASKPAQHEESYRLLIDELPDPAQPTAAVQMLIRHSIPVFFAPGNAAPARAQWQIARGVQGETAGFWVQVRNTGTRRLRLSELVVRDVDGSVLAHKPGLVGYVLGQSHTRVFLADAYTPQQSQRAVPLVRLSANGEAGLLETGLLPVTQ